MQQRSAVCSAINAHIFSLWPAGIFNPDSGTAALPTDAFLLTDLEALAEIVTQKRTALGYVELAPGGLCVYGYNSYQKSKAVQMDGAAFFGHWVDPEDRSTTWVQ